MNRPRRLVHMIEDGLRTTEVRWYCIKKKDYETFRSAWKLYGVAVLEVQFSEYEIAMTASVKKPTYVLRRYINREWPRQLVSLYQL